MALRARPTVTGNFCEDGPQVILHQIRNGGLVLTSITSPFKCICNSLTPHTTACEASFHSKTVVLPWTVILMYLKTYIYAHERTLTPADLCAQIVTMCARSVRDTDVNKYDIVSVYPPLAYNQPFCRWMYKEIKSLPTDKQVDAVYYKHMLNTGCIDKRHLFVGIIDDSSTEKQVAIEEIKQYHYYMYAQTVNPDIIHTANSPLVKVCANALSVLYKLNIPNALICTILNYMLPPNVTEHVIHEVTGERVKPVSATAAS